jgi:NADH-quinone oxidoreductase subunit N
MTSTDYFAVSPLILLLCLALVVTLVDLWVSDARRNITYYATQFSLAAVAVSYLVLYGDGLTQYAFQRLTVADPMGHLLGAFAVLATMVAVAYARPYIASRDMFKGEFFTLTMFSLLGIGVMISANNFLVLYLGLELMSLSLYALTALRRDHAPATEAAMKYFVLGALASGFLLYGLSMMYGATGTLQISETYKAIGTGQINRAVLVFGVVFVVAGLAFKLGAVPFHMWVPDVYQGAPTAVTLLIGGAPKLAAFAIVVRLLVEGMLGMASEWQSMLVVLAVGSIALGNLAAIAQTNIKRMLAYSTISHMGFMLLGLTCGVVNDNTFSAVNAYSSSLFYVVTYVLTTLGTFGVLMLLARRGHECDNLSDLRGLGRRSPWLAVVMATFMFSLAGVPPTVGFYAKFSVLQALVASNLPGLLGLAIFAVVFSLIGAFFYLRVVKVMFFDEGEQTQPVPAPLDVRVLLSLNGAAILLLGILPGGLMHVCAQSVVRALGT